MRMRRIREWLRGPEDAAEELDYHLEELKRERMDLGETEEQAERHARAAMGSLTAARESVRELGAWYVIENAGRGLRLAFRTLWRHRAAYGSATAILALGIAMSVAMFSLVDAVILRPLPFPDQERIHVIWKRDLPSGAAVVEMAYPELHDLSASVPAFERVALLPATLYGYGRVLQAGTAEPVQIESAPVSHDFFRVLGVAPELGRDFNASDEHPGAAPVAIVSDAVWRDHLGGDPAVIGTMVRLNGRGHTVIGVMAPGVEFPRGAGLWVPLGVEKRMVESRTATFLIAIAKARPNQPAGGIRTQVNTLFTRLAGDHPDAYSRTQQGVVTPLVEYWTGSARQHLWIMLAAAFLLLLAAAISAGNLFLSRTLSRRQELATRAALGGTRVRILAGLGVEGLAAAAIAVSGGLLLAHGGIRLLVAAAPPDIPRLAQASLDWRAFCLAAALALVTAAACSIVPGWLATRRNAEAALREGTIRLTMSRGGARTQAAFVFSQAAVTVALLAMASLLVMSYRSLMSADVGFRNRDAVTMNLALRGPGLFAAQAYTPATRDAFYTKLLEALRQAPGVKAAAAVLLRPFEGPIGWDMPYQFEFEADLREERELPKANFEVVTPGYFEAVGTPLLEGRDFNEHDGEDAEKVAIVSSALAGRMRAAGVEPVGHRMRTGRDAAWMRIAGVVGEARYRGVTRPGATFFVPYRQTNIPTNYVVVRGTASSGELTALVRSALRGIDASQALAGAATIGELIAQDTARHRFNMILLSWFAVCAALLAAMGVYSVIEESVASRGREVAIKAALGAGRPRLMRELVKRTLVLVAAGELAGAAAALFLDRLAPGLLYGVSSRDPGPLAGVMLFLFTVALAAAFAPAWRAAGAKDNGLMKLTLALIAVLLAGVGQTQAQTLGSAVFDWTKLEVAKTANGERRGIVDRPTATMTRFESHVTTLEAGRAPHAPHRHPDEEIVIVKEGTMEVTVNGKTEQAGPGSMFFFASNDLHGMKNAGQGRASYFVIRIATAATPK